MSTKKPREPRKPLNESFLEFVHGSDPELDPANSSVFETSNEHFLQLQQEVVALQQRLLQLEDQLEQSKSDQDLQPTKQVETQVIQLLDRLEQLELRSGTWSGLQRRMTELEQLANHWPSLAQFEDDFKQYMQQVQQMDNSLTSQQIPSGLMERFEAVERTLKEQGENVTRSFQQIESQINTLSQQVGQLGGEVRQLSVDLQHYLDGVGPVLPDPQPTLRQTELKPEKERGFSTVASSLSATPISSNSDSFQNSDTDPLLSRLSSLLDDF